MKTITRDDWAAALLSDKYNKTTGGLRSGNAEVGYSYCALGIACLIAEIEPNHASLGWHVSTIDEATGMEQCGSLLPKAVADMLELDREGIWMVSDANDLKRMPFSAIAAMIPDLPKGTLTPKD